MKETSNYESCNFHKEVVCEKPLCMFFELNNPRAIFVRCTTKMAREMKTWRSIQLEKKKKEATITRKHEVQGPEGNIRTTHQKVKLRAGLSLTTIM